jgi:pyruvate formate lyase activating enzyme
MTATAIKARFFKETPNGVVCMLCPVQCRLKLGQTGRCKVRQNIDGALYTLVYGHPVAAHVDPVEKKPLYHFLPGSQSFSIGTAGCNLTCLNCQNWEISSCSPHEIKGLTMLPHDVVENALLSGCQSISYTYNDPVVFFEYAVDTALLAREWGLRNIMVSAGYINREPLLELCQVMDAANIDLKGFDEKMYRQLNGAHLKNVLQTLVTLKEQGVWLEITNLIIPQWSDNLENILNMCKWLMDNGFRDVPLHFSRFFPKYRLQSVEPTPLKTLQQAYEIAVNAGLRYVYVGNVGNEHESTFCHHCGELLIGRQGYTIVANHIVDGRCSHCGESLPGIWRV